MGCSRGPLCSEALACPQNAAFWLTACSLHAVALWLACGEPSELQFQQTDPGLVMCCECPFGMKGLLPEQVSVHRLTSSGALALGQVICKAN